MAVKVHGVNKLVNELESKFGTKRIQEITAKALDKGSLLISMELYRQLRTFRDKGYTIDELTISDVEGTGSNQTVRIYWKGPHNRYRIIHLNEWGTIRNPNPRGKGKIAKALHVTKREYGNVIRNEIRRAL